jgi:signal transduction histidine kinase
MYSWSKDAMKECAVENLTYTYPVATTGLWGDAIRKRIFQITNDYENNSSKKGYPSGHIAIKKHANVPIFFEGKIVVLIGVGNKEEDYDELDIKKLTIIMETMWRHIQRRNAKAKLEELIKELEEKNRLLAKSNQELMHFAFIASHDLKAPLRAIHNLTTWIEEDLKSGKDVTDYLRLLAQRVTRMDQLTSALLEYSRIGQKHTEKELIDVANVIREVESDLKISGIKFNLTINKNSQCQGARLRANKTRMYQIFANLINNAIKHHNNKENIQIDISCSCNYHDSQMKCQFCVADNGPGIDPQFHEKIFQIFQTLKPRDEVEGAGIGLSLVKKIVEENGGKIWVESKLGEGSKFYFYIDK